MLVGQLKKKRTKSSGPEVLDNTVKFRKEAPGRIFFKGLFDGLIFGGAYVWRETCVSKSIGLAL